MAQCRYCNGDVLLGKPILDGVICKECYSRIPKVTWPFISGYSAQDISLLIGMKGSGKTFEPTATYGKLQIDELHGLFAIEYKGELPVFDCLELDEMGIYCVKPSADRNNSVYCDVEFGCKFQNSNIKLRVELKNHVNCHSHRKDSTHLEWEEPGDLSLFRNMFMQMYDDARAKYNRNVSNNLISKQDIELLKAEALFMISGTYSDTELEEKKTKLLSIYSTDEEQQQVNKAYMLLKNAE